MHHEIFFTGTLDRIYQLRITTGAEGRHHQRLGFTTRKQG